jgi:hypothetical protein
MRGHRSLLEDGKIFHCDISANNIIVTKPAAEGDPKGRLVDLGFEGDLVYMLLWVHWFRTY